MNQGQAFMRMQLPEQPLETQRVENPMAQTMDTWSVADQAQMMQQRRAMELQALKAQMGTLGGWAAEPGAIAPHQNTPSGSQLPVIGKALNALTGYTGRDLGTYNPITDKVQTYTFKEGDKTRGGDVNPYTKAHELRHRAFTEYGLNEEGNRMLDAYQQGLLPKGELFDTIKGLETYLAENPELQTMKNRGSNLATEAIGMNALPLTKMIEKLNYLGLRAWSDPATRKNYTDYFFDKAFE